MTIRFPLLKTSVRAVVRTSQSSTKRKQTLNFRAPRGTDLQQVRRVLSAHIAQINERRSELEPAWSLQCYRRGRRITAVCTQCS